MLHEFLRVNHDELVRRCKVKVAERPAPATSRPEPVFGIPILLDQLVGELRGMAPVDANRKEPAVSDLISSSAGKHGDELLRRGMTVEQVVHDYGDLCQAVTELAQETDAPITVHEFHTFNRCLDNAIAEAVTEFGRQRDRGISEEGTHTLNERLGFLAHELRNLLNSATLAFEALKRGHAPIAGATGAVLGRSLIGLRELIDRTLADVRLTDGLRARRERLSVRDLLAEAQVYAALDAKARGMGFTASPVDESLTVSADRQMISSAIANLLQNALKFGRPGSQVSLTAHAKGDRIEIDVEDECGGLLPGRTEELFQPFTQRSGDKTGLGLGLSISRRGVEANSGKLHVRSLPGKGCVFTIDLPREYP